MSIASEISRLQNAKAALKTSIENKGVTVSSSAKLDTYPALVESIQQGGGYEENVWYLCGKDWAKYSLNYNNGMWLTSDTYRVYLLGKLCWLEFNGEKYYVDSISNGAHTLTKQGEPVGCTIFTFMTLSIRQSGSNYILNVAED